MSISPSHRDCDITTVSWHTEKVSPHWSSHPPASGGRTTSASNMSTQNITYASFTLLWAVWSLLHIITILCVHCMYRLILSTVCRYSVFKQYTSLLKKISLKVTLDSVPGAVSVPKVLVWHHCDCLPPCPSCDWLSPAEVSAVTRHTPQCQCDLPDTHHPPPQPHQPGHHRHPALQTRPPPSCGLMSVDLHSK